MAKYGMSECTLGHAGEFKPHGIARQQPVAAHRDRHRGAADDSRASTLTRCRTPEILADAAYLILTSDAKTTTGNFFIDDELLAQHGITDLDRYSVTPGTKDFIPDFFVD